MKWFKNSLSAVFHLTAWLILFPFLLFLIFRNVSYSANILNSYDDKILLVILIAFVGFINSRILIPRFLYFRKNSNYFFAAFFLLLLSAVFDFTLSTAFDPVLTYLESISWTRIAALATALIISSSIRIIHDQNRNFSSIQE